MANSGITPAILAGNTVVFKPSEHTTLTQKKFAEILQDTGLPEGVLNIVVGGAKAGRTLIDAPIDLVWFTGSTKAGQEIFEKCGEKFVKALLELGGSSAGIVFEDADLKKTVGSIFWARFSNCGQVCTAIKRLFVQEKIYKEFLTRYIEKIKTTVMMGNPMTDKNLGPLVSKKQLTLLEQQVEDALKKGAKAEIGGKRPKDKELSKGNYFEPTVLTNVNFDMRVMKEEVFGPVLPIMPFENENQVIEMANNTPYGLSNEIYTANIEKAENVAKQLKSGTVAINTDDFFKPEVPFGGMKKSGMGREYGRVGFQEFAQIKTICVKKM